jgi:hypothetical protein
MPTQGETRLAPTYPERSVRVAVDDVVLSPPLLAVEGAVLEIADADGRRLVQRVLALGPVVDVTVVVVDANRTVPLLVELLEMGTASHWLDEAYDECSGLDFARTAEAIAGTPSTLEKVRLLADYLGPLSPEDLRRAAV